MRPLRHLLPALVAAATILGTVRVEAQGPDNVQKAMATLDSLAKAPPPAGMSAADKSAWDSQTQWLQSVHQRFNQAYAKSPRDAASGQASGKHHELQSPRDAASGLPTGKVANATGGGVVSPRDLQSGQASGKRQHQWTPELQTVYDAVQMESRKFQTLSNAQKSRHDVAMNAIRNMKA